ncbi:MAG: DNA polymerase I [Clostridia bacterium]|nr:DNA polymerase I [Clostridia bacterium]
MKTLLVVDGNSILNRAFYGIRTLTNSAGLPTNAVYGLVTMLTKQLEKYSPDYAAIAFDLRAPTFRHKMYGGYKATRKGMPEELALQMPYAKRVAEALGFTIIEKEGYEADDILGSLANHANDSGEDVLSLIMTGDKDSLQLINDKTAILLATNVDYVYFDRDAFREKYGVDPEQFVDVKAIMGDSSDNIPGISGIGEKGALSLIAQFGTLENVYESYLSSDLKPSVVKKLEAGRESAFLSQTLARIEINVPELPEVTTLVYRGIEKETARKLFEELEFGAFIKKFDLEAVRTEAVVSSENVVSVNDKQKLLEILSHKYSAVFFDGATLYAYDGKQAAEAEFDIDIANTMANNASQIMAYDVKSIYEAADQLGVRFRNIADDIMLAAYVLDSQGGHDIDRLSMKYLGTDISNSVSKAVVVKDIADIVLAKFQESVSEKLYREIELPLAGVLADMEEAGFCIDMQGLADYGEKLKEEADALAERIYFLAGEEFNINSPKQLGNILFEKLNLPSGKKTKTGYSTNAEILEKLSSKHPIVSDILDYRQLTKLIGTYVVGLLKLATEEGRIHTNFKQTGTATGRLSSAEPNLQNIPVRTDAGRELRKYFLPRKGYKLISADYSQIELRLLACIANDEAMLSAFESGIDIHTSTASAVFGVPIDMVTPILRKRAKAVNFGIVYGIGEYSLSQDLDITVKQAKEYIESYLASYPGVSAYLRDIVKYATENGSVDTLYGRTRYIPEIQSKNGVMRKFGERVAMNSPIQGSAADIIKIAMLNVSKRLNESDIDAKLILQVHDELIIEARADQAEEAALILKEEMENAVQLPIPLTVDLSIGERWYET